MTEPEFRSLIFKTFSFDPTPGQEALADSLLHFLQDKSENPLFLLKGYAGTGKTTMVSELVRVLGSYNVNYVLMAPTGRAAKVLSSYTAMPAHTIHRKIYLAYRDSNGQIIMKLMPNRYKNTIFIIDEASMIHGGNITFSGNRLINLLDDVFKYVYSGRNCRLIILGDTAQLPPVGFSESPALDAAYLKSRYSGELYFSELNEVVRQSEDSGILYNATLLRKKIASLDFKPPFFQLKDFKDVIRTNPHDLSEQFQDHFSREDREEAVVVTRSNKRANLYNQAIRTGILVKENDISAGDPIMVVKNNYFWLDEDSKAGFIANGDMLRIMHLSNRRELYGYDFIDASCVMSDYNHSQQFDATLLLDTIMSESASLPEEQYLALFEEVKKDYADEPTRGRQMERVLSDPNYNALQIKFAHALTCHKTQGGQWENVFIDYGYMKEENIDKEFLRWLYTAFTRATQKIYLINFDDSFFYDA